MAKRDLEYPKTPHKTGRAAIQCVRLFGRYESGTPRKIYLLGRHGSTESYQHFAEIKAKLDEVDAAAREKRKAQLSIVAGPARFRIQTLAAQYKRLMIRKSNKSVSEKTKARAALKMLVLHQGKTVAKRFDSACLLDLREKMIEKGWGRDYINKAIRVVVDVLKWGTLRKLIPSNVYADAILVDPLKRGESKAPEPVPVKPAKWRDVRQVLPHVSRVVADMLRIHYLTGMRSAELTGLRMSELDTRKDVWIYRKEQHKTAHHGKKKVICFGPRAQKILKRYIGDGVDYLFRPEDSALEHLERRVDDKGESRSTGQEHAARFDSRTYYHAVLHGLLRLAKEQGFGECQSKFKEGLTPKRGKPSKRKVRVEPIEWLQSVGAICFTPHQLRHARATITEDRYGIEYAAAQTGNSVRAAQIYTEKTLRRAKRVAREMG